MNDHTCSLCHEQPAEIKCYCSDPHVQMCPLCAPSHFLQTTLRHRPLPCYHVISPYECQMCHSAKAVYMCKCMYPWVTYCCDCLDEHVRNIDKVHETHPAVAMDFFINSRSFQEYMDRQKLIDVVEAALQANMDRVRMCQEAVVTLAKDMTIAVESWRESTLQSLRTAEKVVQRLIETCMKVIEPYRYQWKIETGNKLEQLLSYSNFANVELMKSDFQLFTYTLHPEQVLSPLQSVLEYQHYEGLLASVKHLYYLIPRSTRLLAYSVPSTIPLDVTVQMKSKFKSFSSWCEFTPGVLCVTGGYKHSAAKGVYFREAKLINLTLMVVTPMPDMNVERCRHALLAIKGSIYAFGGYNDAYLKSIEKFDTSVEEWVETGSLSEAKDCVSAAIWQDKVYLVGYGSKKIEIFDPNTCTTTLFPVKLRYTLMNLLAPKYTTLLCVYNNQLVLLLEQELMTVNLVSGKTSCQQIPQKMDKSWFCQCLPVIVGDSCYFFNLDQEIWVLNLRTSSFEFATRIALQGD